MQDNVGIQYILNETLGPAKDMEYIDTDKNNVIYEVIRIMDRVPLFMEGHYTRLKKSLNLAGAELELTQQELRNQIRALVDANGQVNCNVKVIVYRQEDKQNSVLYISKSYYPGEEEFQKGVKTGLLRWERANPNIKIINQAYREAVDQKIKENHAFEVLLVNNSEKITEGSKSNVFFVKGEKVYTAPGECVLKGVTRKHIIDVCKKIGLDVIETLIGIDSLNEMEGLFISGTSIKVLPVAMVDERIYTAGTHPTITAISSGFNRFIEEYIKKNS